MRRIVKQVRRKTGLIVQSAWPQLLAQSDAVSNVLPSVKYRIFRIHAEFQRGWVGVHFVFIEDAVRPVVNSVGRRHRIPEKRIDRRRTRQVIKRLVLVPNAVEESFGVGQILKRLAGIIPIIAVHEGLAALERIER